MNTSKKETFPYVAALMIITLAVSIVFSIVAMQKGVVTSLIDQNAHLNIARQITDNLTPGMSQIGFWPPLLHVLMAPAAAVDYLYHSGYAGAVTLIPFLMMGVYFMYRLTTMLSGKRLIGFFSGLIFLTNPFVLYYTVTPMMEMLFISLTLGVAFFFLKWLHTESFFHLSMAGIFTALATTARFEGIILWPLLVLLIFVKFRSEGRRFAEIEATTILFSVLALIGLGFILGYGFVYTGNPLAFMTGEWSASAQQEDFLLPAEGKPLLAFVYLLTAGFHLIGFVPLILSLSAIVLILLWVHRDERFAFTSVYAILLAPIFFIWLSLVRGSTVMYVPELEPIGEMFNERYSLSFISIVALTLPVLFTTFTKQLFNRDLMSARIFAFNTYFCVGFLFLFNYFFLLKTVSNDFELIAYTTASYTAETESQIEMAHILTEEYDGGKVLITKALHNYIPVEADLSLSSYIMESNYKFYDQALERPWIFARFVVMYNPGNVDEGTWRGTNEKVSYLWHDSKDFNLHYELIHENYSSRLYKLREDESIRIFNDQGLDLTQIPSLNTDIIKWDPDFIYQKINSDTLVVN